VGTVTSVATAPSLLALRTRYDVALGGQLGADDHKSVQAGALDSSTSAVALGLIFSARWATPRTEVEDLPGWAKPSADLSHDEVRTITAGGALATSLAQRQVGVGIGVMGYHRDSALAGVRSAVNGTVSVSGYFAEQVAISLTGENIVPLDQPEAPLRIAVGAGWSATPVFGGYVDLVQDYTDPDHPAASWSIGAEVQAGRQPRAGTAPAALVPLRAGYTHDALKDRELLGLGLGVGDGRGFLEYGLRWELPTEGDEPAFRAWHALSLRLSFS
jgi:hypothetical protein